MIDNYLLDASALIAYLNDEDGADVVDDMLTKAYDQKASISMSIVNVALCEAAFSRASEGC